MRAHKLILYTRFCIIQSLEEWTMFTFTNKPRAALVLLILFAFLVLGAQALEPPAKSTIHLGSFGLVGSPAVLANNSSISNSSITNISINNSTINNSSMSNEPIKNLSLNDKQIDASAPIVPVVDLSNYAKDRKSKNLAGYRNIMYPMGESRGPPAAAAGGSSSGGGGGGCGCTG